MRVSAVCLIFLVAALAQGAEIYRRADRGQGVEFSDKPDPSAERVILREPVVVPIPGYPPSAPSAQQTRPAVKLNAASAYNELKVLEPADDATVRANDGTIAVQVLLSPPLQVELGHVLLLRFDGVEMPASNGGTSFSLIDVPRGTHELQAVVIASDGSPVMASAVSRFHLHRQTIEPRRPPKGAKP